MIHPNQPTQALSGIGPKLAKTLSQCGLHTVQDLLFHLPYRYQDRTRLTPIRDLREGDWAVIQGEITQVSMRGRRLEVVLEHFGSTLTLVFFHTFPGLHQRLQPQAEIRAFGEVRWLNGRKCMAHPEWSLMGKDNITPPLEEHLTPIYASTQGLGQKRLRQCIQAALASTQTMTSLPASLFDDPFNPHPPFNDTLFCLRFLHNPPPDVDQFALIQGQHPAQQYLSMEELLAHGLAFKRAQARSRANQAIVCPCPDKLFEHWQQQLPFTLTKAQQLAIKTIHQDMQRAWPMLRLLQGDVGSGKTMVAVAASLCALAADTQVAVMAPTELLAEQLYSEFHRALDPLAFAVTDLLGKHTSQQKKQRYQAISDGSAQVVIGTHALFQQTVSFHRLGLIIIDEQHRFGVKQRFALQAKGNQDGNLPHQLLMTATPIPRTLAMANLTHLAVSILDERPPGRMPIHTAVIEHHQRDCVIERLTKAIDHGKQAYWVCPLVEQSDELQCEAAEQTTQHLRDSLPAARIGLVHGRMNAEQKSATMQAFLTHELDILVATTVIEVGVNVPNATLMIIDNAERLGLAQLHQLRGRVGRGQAQSFCVLIAQSPLSEIATQRLQIIKAHQDGFQIAEADLRLRGAGEVVGTKQTGLMRFKVTPPYQFARLSPHIAQRLAVLDEQHPDLAEQLLQRWLGENQQYVSA